MPLIHCKINLVPTWSANCVISSNTASNQETIFVITDTKLHVPVITLSTDCNVNVEQQLTLTQNKYLDYLIDPSFQGVNNLFVLLYENNVYPKIHTRYFLPIREIKNYDVMIDERNVSISQKKKWSENIQTIPKIATDQGDDDATRVLLDFSYFEKYDKIIATDLSR